MALKEVLLAKAGALREVLRAEEPRRRAVAIVTARAGLIRWAKEEGDKRRLRRRIGLIDVEEKTAFLEKKHAKLYVWRPGMRRLGWHSDSRSDWLGLRSFRVAQTPRQVPATKTMRQDSLTTPIHLLGRPLKAPVT